MLNKLCTFSKLLFSTSWNGAGSICSSVKLTGFSISFFSHSLCSSNVMSILLGIFLLLMGELNPSPKSQPELVLLLFILKPEFLLVNMACMFCTVLRHLSLAPDTVWYGVDMGLMVGCPANPWTVCELSVCFFRMPLICL